MQSKLRFATLAIVLILSFITTLDSFHASATSENGKTIVRRYLNAYIHINTKAMNSLAGRDTQYSKLISSGMPRRITSFAIIEEYALDVKCPETKKAKEAGQAKHYHIGANDPDANTLRLIAYVSQGKIAKMTRDTCAQVPARKRKGKLLPKADRLQIYKELKGTKTPLDDFYVDFSNVREYKGYTEVSPSEGDGSGAQMYWKKVNGKWRVIMETQDMVTRQQLDKLGIPRDVQDEVWGSVTTIYSE